MKVKIVVGFICLFYLANFSIAQEGTLSLDATFDKAEYGVGQPVKLTVTIINSSPEKVSVRWETAMVKVLSEGEVLFASKGSIGSRGKIMPLKPGTSWSNELEFSSKSNNMPAAGDYQVIIKYKNNKETSDPTKKKGRVEKLWTGEVKTTAAIKITD